MNFDTNYNTTEGKRETGGGHGSFLSRIEAVRAGGRTFCPIFTVS